MIINSDKPKNTMQGKLYLVGMSGPNSYENLVELIDPVKDHFDGVVWVLHDSVGSKEAQYLESVKGDGRVIHYYFSKRHDESRNQYLWCGPIKNGDWCCQIDTLERVPVIFAKNIREYIAELEGLTVDMAYFYGKPYLYKYHESMKYVGSPHECLTRYARRIDGLELNQFFKNENDVRINVRPIKRPDKFNFVDHYLNYYLYPWGSNQCLLGLENKENSVNLFTQRDKIRLDFKDYLLANNVESNAAKVKDWFVKNKDNPSNDLKYFINNEKILNDVWRYYILDRNDFSDNHDYNDMIKL